VVCWGNNEAGQCVVPSTARKVQQIAAGGYFTAAIMLPEPDITMAVENRGVPDGFRHDFLVNTGGTLTRTFMIVNNGTAPLTGLTLTLDGADSANFTPSVLPVTTLAPGTSTTFTVTFQPDAARACLAGLHIASNDPDESPFDCVLSGRTPMGAVQWVGDRPDLFLDRIPVAVADIAHITANYPYSAPVRGAGGDAGIGAFGTTTGAVHEWSPRGAHVGSQILPPSAAVRKVVAGSGHFLALRGDGTLHGWGENLQGQATVPTGLSGVIDIAAGVEHSVALLEDGTVRAWGSDTVGQTSVPPGLRAVDVAAGHHYTLALLGDGTVVAWGTGVTVPVGLSDVIAIEASLMSSPAIRRDGSIVVFDGVPPLATLPRPAALALGVQR